MIFPLYEVSRRYELICTANNVLMMTMMMMSGFAERVINNPQTRYRSAKRVGHQMSSERQRERVAVRRSGW